jgi:hypothetical protein
MIEMTKTLSNDDYSNISKESITLLDTNEKFFQLKIDLK